MINKFSSSPTAKIKKLNSILRRQFGMEVKTDVSMETLGDLKTHISESIQRLKISGKDSKRDPELSKNLLMMEAISAIMEKNRLDEYDGHMGARYAKVIDWLTDYAFKNVELGDNFDEAIAEAMKQYRSSKYRFDDALVQHEVKKRVSKRLEDVQMQEGHGDFDLERQEDDPWAAEKHVAKPSDPATDPDVLRAIRQKYENVSESKVAEMKRNYIKTLRAILENEELQQAEVLVAAQGFSKKLQEIIQKIGRMQNEDMGTVVEQMRQAYGPEIAMTFQQDLHADLDQILQELRQTKGEIEQAVEGMSGGGGISNDMMGDDGMGDDGMGDDLGIDGEMGDVDADIDADIDTEIDAEIDDLGDDMMGGVDAAAMDDEPLGRVAKESKEANLLKRISEMKNQIARLKKLKEGNSVKK